jgi:2-dehydropantoate 2-reductase
VEEVKVLIWGAGAIGGTIGAYLARAGHEVTLVDQNAEHVKALRERGLRITGPIDEFECTVPAFTPEELRGAWQTVLLCVKAHHTPEATRQLAPHLAPDGHVVSAQNGLNERMIREVVGEERTIGCFVNFGADYLEPGIIHYGGRGAVVVGELDGSRSQRVLRLRDLLARFDEQATVTGNIWGFLWGKMAYGSLLFATALTNASIADALANERYHPVYRALGGEVLSVAAAEGVSPEGFNGFDPKAFAPGASPEAARASIDEMVAFNRRSAKTHSGIWRDLAVRKRKTEVDAQLAVIPEIGAGHGLELPVCERLISLIREMEEGKRDFSWQNLDLLSELT